MVSGKAFLIVLAVAAILSAILIRVQCYTVDDDRADRIREAVCAEQQHYTAIHTQWLIQELLKAADDSTKAERQAAYNAYILELKNAARLTQYQIDHPDSDTFPAVYK